MPELKDRPKHEADVAKALGKTLEEHRRQWAAATPDQAAALQAKQEEELLLLLLLLMIPTYDFAYDELLASRRVVVGGDVRRQAYDSWSRQYARTTAGAIAQGSAKIAADSRAGGSTATLDDVSSVNRIARWAVNIVTGSVSAGEFSAADRYQAVTGKTLVAIWVTEKDGKVCPICKPLDGLPYSIWGNKFPSGPRAHDNCRCFLKWVLSTEVWN